MHTQDGNQQVLHVQPSDHAPLDARCKVLQHVRTALPDIRGAFHVSLHLSHSMLCSVAVLQAVALLLKAMQADTRHSCTELVVQCSTTPCNEVSQAAQRTLQLASGTLRRLKLPWASRQLLQHLPLDSLTQLRHLCISQAEDCDAGDVAAQLAACSSTLTSLEMAVPSCKSANDAVPLAQGLASLTALQTLVLSGRGSYHRMFLLHLLAACSELTCLRHLEAVAPGRQCLHVLAHTLRSLTDLRSLRLRHSYGGSLSQLSCILTAAKHLTQLCTESDDADADAAVFADLAKLRELRSLSVSVSGHASAWQPQHASTFASSCAALCQLQHLHLYKVRNQHSSLVVQGLAQLTALQSARFELCKDGLLLARVLSPVSALRSLAFVRCYTLLQNTNAADFAAEIVKCSGLSQLCLSRCSIDDRAVQQLTGALLQMTALRELDLSCNSLQNKGVCCLGVRFAQCSLQLNVAGNPGCACGVIDYQQKVPNFQFLPLQLSE